MTRFYLGEQTKGACLVPKRALRVMEGEVNRIMQLTSNSVIPIMYQVPRKTYRDFHGDLYPDTNGYRTDLSVSQWLNGVNIAVPKMSLDPAKRELGDQPIIVSCYMFNIRTYMPHIIMTDKNAVCLGEARIVLYVPFVFLLFCAFSLSNHKQNNL